MLNLFLPSFPDLTDRSVLEVCLDHASLTDLRQVLSQGGTLLSAQNSADALSICGHFDLSHIVLDVHQVDEYGPLLIKHMRDAFCQRDQPTIAAVGAGRFPAFIEQLRDAGADVVLPAHELGFLFEEGAERPRCIA